jgi:hypothetical protein
MKFAIVVVLLAVVVGVFTKGNDDTCEGQGGHGGHGGGRGGHGGGRGGHGGGRGGHGGGKGPKECNSPPHCAIDGSNPAIQDKQVRQINEIVDGLAGPNVGNIVAPSVLQLVQKLPVVKSASPAVFDLIIQLLRPCGIIERFLANGKTPQFNADQKKQFNKLRKQLTRTVGPNTGCGLARLIVIAENGALSSQELQPLVKVVNLVLCVASNKSLTKALEPVLQIVHSLLSKKGAGNVLGGVLGGTVGGVLKNPLGALKGLATGVLKDLNKCLKAAGIDLNKITGGLTGKLTGGIL